MSSPYIDLTPHDIGSSLPLIAAELQYQSGERSPIHKLEALIHEHVLGRVQRIRPASYLACIYCATDMEVYPFVGVRAITRLILGRGYLYGQTRPFYAIHNQRS